MGGRVAPRNTAASERGPGKPRGSVGTGALGGAPTLGGLGKGDDVPVGGGHILPQGAPRVREGVTPRRGCPLHPRGGGRPPPPVPPGAHPAPGGAPTAYTRGSRPTGVVP